MTEVGPLGLLSKPIHNSFAEKRLARWAAEGQDGSVTRIHDGAVQLPSAERSQLISHKSGKSKQSRLQLLLDVANQRRMVRGTQS